jgi:transcriptional regulator with XRE-family HTH domain
VVRIRLDPEGLRRELARRGMTQTELAAAAGLTQATVSHAATGQTIDHTTLRKLAHTLAVTPPLNGADLIIAPLKSTAEAPTPAVLSDSGGRTGAAQVAI